MDKLDGRIDDDFFDRKAGEFRSHQCRLMRDIEAHRKADQSYIEEGIRLLGLAQKAQFESRSADGKRKLLDFVLSNCNWKGGPLEATYRLLLNLIAAAAWADR